MLWESVVRVRIVFGEALEVSVPVLEVDLVDVDVRRVEVGTLLEFSRLEFFDADFVRGTTLTNSPKEYFKIQ